MEPKGRERRGRKESGKMDLLLADRLMSRSGWMNGTAMTVINEVEPPSWSTCA